MAEFKSELILQTESGQSVAIDLRNALVLSSAPTTATKARVGMQAYVVAGNKITEYVCTAVSGSTYTWVKRDSGGGEAGGSFTAVYGTTPYAEIRAAYDAGKTVIVTEGARVYTLSMVGSGMMRFACQDSLTYSRVTVDASVGWSKAEETMEGVKNKVTQITGDATDTQYPSAKAVRDYVAGNKDYVTPQMFGAVGDGVADDTAAIQAALDNGGYIYFPAGRYKTTQLLTASKSCRIEMFKPYPQTYKAEYPLTPADNWMGARIDTYSPNGGMVIGDSVEVDGLFIRAMEGFAGVILTYDDTVGYQNYPSMTRIKHVKLEIDSPNTIPVSMFDFQPNDSYRHILEDIVLGRSPDAGYCEYGFRTDMTKTTHKWAYNVTIRDLCIDLHADYPLYIKGDDSLGLSSWLFEMLTIQAYKYNRNEEDMAKNPTNRPGHIDMMTLENTYLFTFVNSYIWDLGQASVTGEVIRTNNIRDTSVIGCNAPFDAIESYLAPKFKQPENLNITNLEVKRVDSADGTADILSFYDGVTERKTVEIPKVQMTDEQIGNAVGTWMDANAEPKEVAGKNKFDYADKDCILAAFNVGSNELITAEQNPAITNWVTPYIATRTGDIVRITCNNNKRNPYMIGCYNANKELIAILRDGFTWDTAQNGFPIPTEGTEFIRIEFNTSTYGSYEDRASAKVCVTINNADSSYEDYYTELVGGIGSFMALQSPNGTKYTLSVDDNGVLSAKPVN